MMVRLKLKVSGVYSSGHFFESRFTIFPEYSQENFEKMS
jgi:hypothetical protein